MRWFGWFNISSGVLNRVIFDNGKVVVKNGFGTHVRKQADYASHYGFEAMFCNPGADNEKRLVEGFQILRYTPYGNSELTRIGISIPASDSVLSLRDRKLNKFPRKTKPSLSRSRLAIS